MATAQARDSAMPSNAAPGATSRNPATGEIIAHYPFQTMAEIEATLATGDAAFRTWRALPVEARAEVIGRLSAILDDESVCIR